MSQKTALVLVSDGVEEIEAVTVIDVLVRAGVKVFTARVQLKVGTEPYIICSRGLKIVPDIPNIDMLDNATTYDALIIPGGLGQANTLSENSTTLDLVKKYYESNKIVAMICAGPLVAKVAGIHIGKKITSHPSVKDQFEMYDYIDTERVIVDGNFISSRGPGTALLWSLIIVENLVSRDKRDEISGPLILPASL